MKQLDITGLHWQRPSSKGRLARKLGRKWSKYKIRHKCPFNQCPFVCTLRGEGEQNSKKGYVAFFFDRKTYYFKDQNEIVGCCVAN